MITETDLRDVKTFGEAKESNFSMQQSAKIFKILRSNIYSNKILTVIREYSTNAWDAQVLAGNSARPIDVYLPTPLSPIFKIRDYGVGLSEEDVMNVYTTYGASTKDSSNDFNGTFGLGSKSAFAYGNTFGITSYFNGIKTVYTAYIDDSDKGKMRREFSVPTDEENGVEIEISVKSSDISAFSSTAIEFYKFFNPCPRIFGPSEITNKIKEFHNRPIVFSASNWKLLAQEHFNEMNASKICMGNVAYPISWDSISHDEFFDSKTMNFFKSNTFIIDVPIGSVSITVTRESLEYDNKTKAFIIETLKRVVKEHTKIVQDNIDNADTFYNACCALNESGSIAIGNLNLDVWKKSPHFIEPINSNSYYSRNSYVFFDNSYLNKHLLNNNVTVTSYSYFNSPRISGNKINNLSCKSSDVYVLNLPKKVKKEEIKWRIRGVNRAFPNSVIYLINFESTDTSDAVRNGFLKGANIVNLEDFDIVKYNGNNSYKRSSTSTASKSSISNDKTKSKIFTLNSDLSYNNYSKSENWEVADKNILTNGSGVYVSINSYETNNCVFNLRTIYDIIGRLEKLNIVIPTIYGIRNSVENISSKFIKFEDWLTKTLVDHSSKNGLNKKIADYNFTTDMRHIMAGGWRKTYVHERIRLDNINHCDDIKEFLTDFDDIANADNVNIFGVTNLVQDIKRYYLFNIDLKLPESQMIKRFADLKIKYPMIERILNLIVEDNEVADLIKYMQVCNQVGEVNKIKLEM